MNIDSLLQEAFFHDDALRATQLIDTARAQVAAAAHVDAFSMEVVVPDQPDETWLAEHVLRPLVYFCQSTGVPPPACAGVFVTFFRGEQLYCVLAAEVIAWSARQLGVDDKAILERYGTHEDEHSPRRAPA
jgi:hypothetical protein